MGWGRGAAYPLRALCGCRENVSRHLLAGLALEFHRRVIPVARHEEVGGAEDVEVGDHRRRL